MLFSPNLTLALQGIAQPQQLSTSREGMVMCPSITMRGGNLAGVTSLSSTRERVSVARAGTTRLRPERSVTQNAARRGVTLAAPHPRCS